MSVHSLDTQICDGGQSSVVEHELLGGLGVAAGGLGVAAATHSP